MCTSPIRVNNHSVYYPGYSQPTKYQVPCGHCLECRNLGMSEWQQRLSYEIKSLYSSGGVAVFLTFTFDNNHLPYFVYHGKTQSCFDRKRVLQFLNRLKVRIYRKYGKGSYKYFFTSEYGKFTKRPHHHALFFLKKGVNIIDFCETCRELWSINGFMFPKYDKYRNCYVDNSNNVSQVTIKSLAGGAKYVSKYITKDLSYYNLPIIQDYLNSSEVDCNCLPKHWQSNGLGYQLVNEVFSKRFDEDSVKTILRDGVMNPLTGKVMPLPRYVINKLMYNNVRTGRVNADGKPLYDRELSAFGKVYMKDKILAKLNDYTNEVFSFLQNINQYDKYIKNLGLQKLYKFSASFDSLSSCKRLACYNLVLKWYPVREVYYFVRQSYGDLSILSDFGFISSMYVFSKNTEYFRTHYFDGAALDDCPNTFPLLEDIERDCEYVTSSFNRVKALQRKSTAEHYQRLDNAVAKMRLFFNAFPNNMC